MEPTLTPDLLLWAYRRGIFPMADPEDDDALYWYAPDPRAVLPLDAFHAPHNLRKLLRRGTFEVAVDRDFVAVIRACAAREATWISDEIVGAYTALHARGYAHSVECYLGGALAGGLYGVAIGGAFFGESMFHHERDASKVALAHLVRRLRAGGFTLLDVQFSTPHLARFGVVEIPRARYEQRLARALDVAARWHALDEEAPGAA